MARRVQRGGAKTKDDRVAYFFLIKQTDQGAKQSDQDKQAGQDAVTQAVKEAGGACSLYSTRGADNEYISVMTGLSPAAAVRIAGVIESRGTVKAKLIIGSHIAGQVSV